MIRMIAAAAILCFSSIPASGATPEPYECTIAFVEQQHPYHLRFMNHLGELSDPVFLPDGVEVDTSGYNSISWSPDGEFLAYASRPSGSLDICFLEVYGGGLGLITDDPADEISPAWSPEGAQIAFLSNRNDVDHRDLWDIYLRDLVTNTERRLTSTSGRYSSLAWSPDGDKIVYVRRVSVFQGDEIFVLDVATLGVVQLSSLSEPRFIQGLQWTPSEDRLLFYAPSTWGSIYTLGAGGTDLVDVTAGVVAEISDHPSWYPCDQILYVKIDASEQIQICKMAQDGTDVTPIGAVPQFPWSPRYRFAAPVLPNLIVADLSVGECSAIGECVVSFTVKNAGTAASPETTVYVEGIWPDPPGGVNEVRIQKHVAIPGLEPGESHAGGESFVCNEMSAKDVHLIRVTVDPKRQICELIETDNEAECDWP